MNGILLCHKLQSAIPIMLSSTFTSILAAAMFLASPAASVGNFDIVFKNITINFQTSVTNELTLDYNIGKDSEYQVDLYEKTCTGSITGMAVTKNAIRTADVTANYDGLEVTIDLDKSTITSSNIWSVDDSLELCVRLQLLSYGEVIKEE